VRVSIIMPAWNAARWIGAAIGSVLAQTHRDWRLVVVDDGSTDTTAAVAAGFDDVQIALIRQPHTGVAAARNAGIAAGLDAAVLFLDADDRLAPDALARLVAALNEAPHAVAACGGYTFEDMGVSRAPLAGDLLERLLIGNVFANGGHLLLRGAAVRRAGGFVPGIAYGEDWEFWIRIALQGPFVAVRDTAPALHIRQHPTGAYQRLAADPAAFEPCMRAIFNNPALLARFGHDRLAAIRRQAVAESHWVIGREQFRHGRTAEGLRRMRVALLAHPSLRRAMLLAAAHMLRALPPAARGRLRPYTSGPSH